MSATPPDSGEREVRQCEACGASYMIYPGPVRRFLILDSSLAQRILAALEGCGEIREGVIFPRHAALADELRRAAEGDGEVTRAPTREKAQAIFERKLLAAEKQGTRCNLRGTTVPGGCAHTDKLACWAALYGLLFEALNYGRRRGLISIMDPWSNRSWLEKESPKP